MDQTQENTHALEAKNIDFYYGQTQTLFDVSCVVRPGRIVGLIGPNGAGKTTLMKCLAGFRLPESGKVFVDNMDVEKQTKKCLGLIKFIPDYAYLYDDLTVKEHLRYTRDAHRAKTTVDSIIELFGLQEYQNHRIKNLSRGWRQRMGVAAQVIAEPKYILADEPASGLDPVARIALSEILVKLKHQGMGVLVSSHILEELDQYCDEVIIMEKGRVTQQTSIEQTGFKSTSVVHQFELKTLKPAHHVLETLEALRSDLRLVDIHPSPEGVSLSSRLSSKELGPKLFENAEKIGLYEFRAKRASIKDIYKSNALNSDDSRKEANHDA